MEQIEKFQEKAYVEFQDYITKTYPDDTYRYLEVKYYLIKFILKIFVYLFPYSPFQVYLNLVSFGLSSS